MDMPFVERVSARRSGAKFGFVLLLMATCLGVPAVHAEPSGAQLLAACESALKTNFRGIHSKLCIWYVTPCDCNFGETATWPRVCLPKSVANRTLALEVTAVLQAIPDLQDKGATEAAASILSVIYPCTD